MGEAVIQDRGVGDRAFALVCTAVYLILCSAATLHHGMWRDELQAWLIARDSGSIAQLIHNVRYEGHGMLFYLMLYPLAHLLPQQPVAMQLLHIVIVTLSAYVVLRFAPFARFVRVLLVLGYFTFFEYGIISRNYALGMLLTFCLCAEWSGRRRLVVMAVIMAAMVNNNVYSFIIVMAFALGMIAASITSHGFRAHLDERPVTTGGCVVFLMMAMLFAAFLLRPPADGGFGQPWRAWPEEGGVEMALHMGARAGGELYNAYLPVPQWREDFWNTSAIWPPIRPFIAVTLLVWAIVSLRRRPVALTVFLAGTLGLIIFAYMKYLGYLRHQGALWVLLVAAFWVAHKRHVSPGKDRMLILLAAAQAVIGCGAWIAAWFVPFSPEKQVVAYLREHHLDHLPIVGHWDHTVSPLSAFLNEPIYLTDSHRWGSFIKWDKERNPISDEDALKIAQDMADQRQSEVILILTPPPNISVYWPSVPGIKELAVFKHGMVDDEKYWVYGIFPRH